MVIEVWADGFSLSFSLFSTFNKSFRWLLTCLAPEKSTIMLVFILLFVVFLCLPDPAITEYYRSRDSIKNGKSFSPNWGGQESWDEGIWYLAFLLCPGKTEVIRTKVMDPVFQYGSRTQVKKSTRAALLLTDPSLSIRLYFSAFALSLSF